ARRGSIAATRLALSRRRVRRSAHRLGGRVRQQTKRGVVLRTLDGGEAWEEQTIITDVGGLSGTFLSIAFVDLCAMSSPAWTRQSPICGTPSISSASSQRTAAPRGR